MLSLTFLFQDKKRVNSVDGMGMKKKQKKQDEDMINGRDKDNKGVLSVMPAVVSGECFV